MRSFRPVPRFLLALIAGLLVVGPAGAQPEAPTPKGIRWTDLSEGLAEAKRSGRPLMVDVSTTWCGWCRKMDKTTYADPAVRELIGRKFIAARVDAEDDDNHVDYGGVESTHRQFADSFRITGYPTTLFFAADGTLITQVPGFVKPDQFIGVLRFIGDGHYKTTSWDAYRRESAGAATRP